MFIPAHSLVLAQLNHHLSEIGARLTKPGRTESEQAVAVNLLALLKKERNRYERTLRAMERSGPSR
jgi:hypothetical protein